MAISTYPIPELATAISRESRDLSGQGYRWKVFVHPQANPPGTPVEPERIEAEQT
jgi:hypothetical protein